MEISSTCLSSVSTSIPRVPPPSLPFCSSNSTFFTSNATISFFNKTKPNNNTLVLGPTKTRSRVERARTGLTCNALFGLGVPELAVIAGVAALVFGPKKLPEVGRSIGKTVKSFQQVCQFNWVLFVFLEYEWKFWFLMFFWCLRNEMGRILIWMSQMGFL